jgi:hypothetical protein
MARGRKTGGRDFVKGQVANPKGRPDGLPNSVRQLTTKEYIELVNDLSGLTANELKEIAKDGSTPAMKAMIANIMAKGIEFGDAGRAHFFLDRLLGPVVQKVETKQEVKQEVMVYTSEWGSPTPAKDNESSS